MRALKVVQALYGRTSAIEFDTLSLLAVRSQMIELDWTRKAINKQITRICGAFHWATEQKLIPAGIAAALQSIKRVQRGRCARVSRGSASAAQRAGKTRLPLRHQPGPVQRTLLGWTSDDRLQGEWNG